MGAVCGAPTQQPTPPHTPDAVHVPAERALELFLQQLCGRLSELAQERGAKTLTPSHLCVHVGGARDGQGQWMQMRHHCMKQSAAAHTVQHSAV